MPTPEQILSGLALAANNYMILSILWHVISLAFLIYILIGKRPSSRLVMAGLTIPLISVGVVALLVSNPFNVIVFLAFSVILWIIIVRQSNEPITVRWDVLSVAGFILVLFGLFYPHFLEDATFVNYLYAAPVGLIPCPTLALVIGFTLMFHGFGSKKWMWYLACIGLFYGIFGVFRLKVYLDTVLLAGALVLFIYNLILRKPSESNQLP